MRRLEINGKRIYVVDNHHETLEPLSLEWRNGNNAALNMLTLDQHCDVMPAFGRCCGDLAAELGEKRRCRLIRQFTPAEPEGVAEAIKLL
ncbi:MAG: hypothetical protein RRY34_02220, partial [Victivallaceae bacterium]